MNKNDETHFPELMDRYLNLLGRSLTASIYDESAWKIIEPQPTNLPTGRGPFSAILNWVRFHSIRLLWRRSLLLIRRFPFNAEVREGGGDWPCFGYTMVGQRRLNNIRMCVEDILKSNVQGDFIETGAWRGGATIFMKAILDAYQVKDRVVWVADSFEGLPRPVDSSDGWDLSHVEHLKVSLEQVRANFERFGLLDGRVKFLKGWFKDTLPVAPIKQLALLRLDGDLYSSTMDSLTNLYSKVSIGGYVIVDDYYSWPACRRAVDEFLSERKINVEIKKIDQGGAYWKVTTR